MSYKNDVGHEIFLQTELESTISAETELSSPRVHQVPEECARHVLEIRVYEEECCDVAM